MTVYKRLDEIRANCTHEIPSGDYVRTHCDYVKGYTITSFCNGKPCVGYVATREEVIPSIEQSEILAKMGLPLSNEYIVRCSNTQFGQAKWAMSFLAVCDR